MWCNMLISFFSRSVLLSPLLLLLLHLALLLTQLMSNTMANRTMDDYRAVLKRSKNMDVLQFYDTWAENYESDISLVNYRGPQLAVKFLSEHFRGRPEDAQVLDVACGTGWVAKLMSELGFRHFSGVDGSKGMLEKAAETKLYQDLKLSILGREPLPVQPDTFDIVVIVGGMDAGFGPVSVLRELCLATKPGGLVCVARGHYSGEASQNYKQDLEKEMQLMEDEGLWRRAGIKQVEKYIRNPDENPEEDEDNVPNVSGTVYMYTVDV